MDKPPTRPSWAIAGVAFLLLILVLQLALSVRQQSQTIDEGAHIWAGYRYWQCADYGMNNEHPPLLKLVAAFPLLLMHLQEPTRPCGFTAIEAEFSDARKFLYANDEDAILFRVRLAASIFTLLLAALLFEVAYRMFGTGPAFLALLLLVFDPNVLAHGALVATDVVVTCCLLAAVYAFYRYTKAPTAWNLFAAGFMAGLTLAAKHSGILAFPILGALALAELWLRCRANGQLNARREALRLAGVLAIVVVVALVVVWAFWEPEEHPYGAFEKIRPSDNIAGSTLVYQGQFNTTLASAMNHQWRSLRFAKEEHWDLALDEARKAVALAPRSPETRYNLGRCLAHQNQTAEARAEYQTVLALAQSDHADFYKSLIRALRRELARSG